MPPVYLFLGSGSTFPAWKLLSRGQQQTFHDVTSIQYLTSRADSVTTCRYLYHQDSQYSHCPYETFYVFRLRSARSRLHLASGLPRLPRIYRRRTKNWRKAKTKRCLDRIWIIRESRRRKRLRFRGRVLVLSSSRPRTRSCCCRESSSRLRFHPRMYSPEATCRNSMMAEHRSLIIQIDMSTVKRTAWQLFERHLRNLASC